MQQQSELTGLRVAVTGGTSGLGLALVRQLCDGGAQVAFLARGAEAVERTAAQTGAFGIVGDVGRKAQIYPLALQITGRLGGLDVLVNNASSLGPTALAPLADTDCEELELALAVNLLGPFRLTKALFGALAATARAGRGALVVNISSDAAVSAYPGWGRLWRQQGGPAAHDGHPGRRRRGARACGFLSLDPGDMNTPLHAAALPEADPASLKRPADLRGRGSSKRCVTCWRAMPRVAAGAPA